MKVKDGDKDKNKSPTEGEGLASTSAEGQIEENAGITSMFNYSLPHQQSIEGIKLVPSVCPCVCVCYFWWRYHVVTSHCHAMMAQRHFVFLV